MANELTLKTSDYYGVSPPRDTFNTSYLLYFLLGVGHLLPWNTFTAAIDYFGLLYPWGYVNRVFLMFFNSAGVIAVLLVTFLGQKISAAWRVNSGLVFSIAMLALVPAMGSIFISNDEGSVAIYALTVTAVAVVGFTHALVQASIVASASRYLPRRYLQGLAAGGGASGLISIFLRIITKAIMPQTESGTVASAYIYFAVCIVIMIGCLISYNLEDKLSVVCCYKYLNVSGPETKKLLNDSIENGDGDDTPVDYMQRNSSKGLEFYKHVWFQVQVYALSLALTYLVTLSIFPGHITEDLSSSYLGDWYPILLILCKETFDVIGRALPGFSIFMTEKKAFVIGGSVARIAFYPLYYLCLSGPAFFRLEVVAMVITCIFGLTNGYLYSVLLMLGPKSVPLDEAEAAGSLMVSLMLLGIFGGVGSAMGLDFVTNYLGVASE